MSLLRFQNVATPSCLAPIERGFSVLSIKIMNSVTNWLILYQQMYRDGMSKSKRNLLMPVLKPQ